MGYDMYWVRDREDPREYFRLNIFAMSRYADAMCELGALRDGYKMDDAPAWPEDIPAGYWDDNEASEEEAQRYREIDEQYRARRVWSPVGPVAGIPAHKFGTNDGWIVTPEECSFAASAIRAAAPGKVAKALACAGITDTDHWNSWVQWIADASEHGGFEVH